MIEHIADNLASTIKTKRISIDEAADLLALMGVAPTLVRDAANLLRERMKHVHALTRPRAMTREDAQEWYPGPSEQDPCWNALRNYLLEKKGWDAAVVQSVGEMFELHPLVMEDILNTDQRPKIEVHEHYLYIVVKVLNFDVADSQARVEQISLILGNGFVLSFQEGKDDIFQGVRTRLESGRRIRTLGPDYLCYALIDTVVDNYFMLLEQFGDQVELLEEELLSNPTPDTLQKIHHYKREMLLLRKAVWPLREVLTSMIRDDSTQISQDTQLYLRDVYDHTIHIMDTVDTIRDLLAGMLDLYISSTSNRMNEIMKVLTIFASIFMPLTFIAGIYGMNFQYMPELSIRWASPAVMAVMALIGVGLAFYFRWKKWL